MKKNEGKLPSQNASPPNAISWSFPPHTNKVGVLPDVAVGLDKEMPSPLMMPDNRSDDGLTTREKGEPVVMGATALPDGDLCCPAVFGVMRPMRHPRITITNRAGDQSSVTCNLV